MHGKEVKQAAHLNGVEAGLRWTNPLFSLSSRVRASLVIQREAYSPEVDMSNLEVGNPLKIVREVPASNKPAVTVLGFPFISHKSAIRVYQRGEVLSSDAS